jgi:transposase-like protein
MKAKENNGQCPFCGGEIRVTHGYIYAPFWFFKCKKCGAVVSFDNDECNRNPERAKEYFKRRVNLQ